MIPELTPAQARFWRYLEHEISRSGKAPSLRRAAADLDISHAAVAQLVRALEAKKRLRREGRYSRTISLLDRPGRPAGSARQGVAVPIVGKIAAGLPLYAQQEWDGTLVVDPQIFRGTNLFALRVQGDSMQDAAILDKDLVICVPRQFARNGEIVVALLDQEEATVKRFFLHPDHVELRPANPAYRPMRYAFERVLIQGKMIGVVRHTSLEPPPAGGRP